METTRKKTKGKTKAERAAQPLKDAQESYVSKLETDWVVARQDLRGAALSLLLREALSSDEEGPDGLVRSVGEGLITDVVKLARRGNSAALNIIFDRTEGKVPSTSVNVNATFTDDERVSRIIGLIKRGATSPGDSEPERSRED